MQKKPSGLLKFRYSKWQHSIVPLLDQTLTQLEHVTLQRPLPADDDHARKGTADAKNPFTAFTCPIQLPLQPETYRRGTKNIWRIQRADMDCDFFV